MRRLEFGPLPKDAHADPPEAWPEALRAAVAQIQGYFARERRSFDLPLDLEAVTGFQREVYDELMKVPYGRVITYGDLADAVGRAELARAVGQAVGANPVPILIPCHRVVAAEGRLGGFTGGLAIKAALLRTENVDVEGETDSSRIRPEVLRLEL
ncbi:MAG TPA: methylated-DNA--[protein]-cysteine S-methyltransferase [Longimicrobiales bacterium]|nr:methylated-DNA--[protein]-cysteine S-methyltransferase [Longimicrobiales bacterium]